MAYASFDDVKAILSPDDEMPEVPTPPAEPSREYLNLATALEEATDLVIGFLDGREWTDEDEDEDGVPDDVPGAVRRVVARVALRGFIESDSEGVESEVNLMGPFSHTLNFSKEAQGSLWLTDGEKMRLERYLVGYSGGATHMPMAGACGDWYAH